LESRVRASRRYFSNWYTPLTIGCYDWIQKKDGQNITSVTVAQPSKK